MPAPLSFAELKRAVVDGGIFAANENPAGYARAVLDYVLQEPLANP